MPPSGHMAGIWARNDDTRGVHKAPANEVVRGAITLELNITKAEHDLLNPDGINCIRAFPGRGIRVWGARTLSSDPAWRYLNVRRLFNYIEESILEGTQWVVFEPNDIRLWGRVKRTINAFLLRVWRDGALFGATPDQAFFVKCDERTTRPRSVDAGQLIVEIGIAPVKPAEFVVFRIAQFSGAPDVRVSPPPDHADPRRHRMPTTDPLLQGNVLLDIDGVGVVANFTSVSGVSTEVEIVDNPYVNEQGKIYHRQAPGQAEDADRHPQAGPHRRHGALGLAHRGDAGDAGPPQRLGHPDEHPRRGGAPLQLHERLVSKISLSEGGATTSGVQIEEVTLACETARQGRSRP